MNTTPTTTEVKKPGLVTQRIGPSAAAAREALGGVPARPPVPKAPNPEAPGLEAKRQAFRDSHLPQAAPAAPAPIGHPTFDPVPDVLEQRRAKVTTVRTRLANLARLITTEHAELMPLIAELAAESAAVKTGELFDPAVARKFLDALAQTVEDLKPAPKKPAHSPELNPTETL